ncbi:uncharacterized protein LOC126833741 [Adelges cooleyi]|uniref:uncharacterized protein LOC126833741 n=1 Tax=Adelges cooleyi TaxID=133065 RepID=UPI0021808676|nr:uncharacterized protein LOC126833741 [Adelges cooleyi]
MANISYFFIILSVCVACTFQYGGPDIYKRDNIIIYQENLRTGFFKFVEEDGVNPYDRGLDVAFIMVPNSPGYRKLVQTINDLGIYDEDIYKTEFTFQPSFLEFDNIFIPGGRKNSRN